METALYCHDAAEAAFDEAEELLGQKPWEHGEAMADNWLELMLEGRALLYMRRWQPDRALAVLEAVQPVLEAHGRPARQVYYYEYRAGLRIRQNRYRIDEEAIGLLRRAVALAVRAGTSTTTSPTLAGGPAHWGGAWSSSGASMRGRNSCRAH